MFSVVLNRQQYDIPLPILSDTDDTLTEQNRPYVYACFCFKLD